MRSCACATCPSVCNAIEKVQMPLHYQKFDSGRLPDFHCKSNVDITRPSSYISSSHGRHELVCRLLDLSPAQPCPDGDLKTLHVPIPAERFASSQSCTRPRHRRRYWHAAPGQRIETIGFNHCMKKRLCQGDPAAGCTRREPYRAWVREPFDAASPAPFNATEGSCSRHVNWSNTPRTQDPS
jgi:hypothetical protein